QFWLTRLPRTMILALRSHCGRADAWAGTIAAAHVTRTATMQLIAGRGRMRHGHTIGMTSAAITIVEPEDFADLLPLVRAYCDFSEVNPSDAALLELSEALCRDPEREGMQLIARSESGEPLGFATIYWTWSTAQAARIGVMNDLFVSPQARGSGLA